MCLSPRAHASRRLMPVTALHTFGVLLPLRCVHAQSKVPLLCSCLRLCVTVNRILSRGSHPPRAVVG